jgi:putative spermidine/putrescine transport system permease protein
MSSVHVAEPAGPPAHSPLGHGQREARGLSRPIGSSGLGFVVFAVALGIGLVLPLTMLFVEAFTGDRLAGAADSQGADGFRLLFGSGFYRGAITRTIRLSLMATAISVFVGYSVALALRRRDGTIRSGPAIVLLLPILAGPLVGVVGFITSFSVGWPGYNLINGGRALLGLETGRVLQTEIAILIGMLHFNLPFVVLTLLPVVGNLPVRMLEVSTTLGAGPMTTFRKVTWPLTRRGVSAAAILALALSLSNFVYPHFLGGGRVPVLTTVVGQAMVSFAPHLAAAAALLLVGLGAVLIVLYGWIVRGN